MNEKIEVTFQYLPEDLIREMEFIFNRSNKTGWTLIFGSAFLCLFALVNIYMAYVEMKKFQFLSAFMILFLVNLIFVFTYFVITRLSTIFLIWKSKRLILKNYDSNSVFYSERNIVIDESGVKESYKPGVFITFWDSFSEIAETATDFHFSTATIIRSIPKKYLTETESNSLKSLAKSKLGERAKFKS
jgi:hypothetical protein